MHSLVVYRPGIAASGMVIDQPATPTIGVGEDAECHPGAADLASYGIYSVPTERRYVYLRGCIGICLRTRPIGAVDHANRAMPRRGDLDSMALGLLRDKLVRERFK